MLRNVVKLISTSLLFTSIVHSADTCSTNGVDDIFESVVDQSKDPEVLEAVARAKDSYNTMVTNKLEELLANKKVYYDKKTDTFVYTSKKIDAKALILPVKERPVKPRPIVRPDPKTYVPNAKKDSKLDVARLEIEAGDVGLNHPKSYVDANKSTFHEYTLLKGSALHRILNKHDKHMIRDINDYTITFKKSANGETEAVFFTDSAGVTRSMWGDEFMELTASFRSKIKK
jgi:hypothetical protein